MGSNGASIIVEELTASYGEVRVLDRVSMSIELGQTSVILGPSGCGKSTLLRHMVGLNRPRSGRILIKGQDITRLPEAKLNEMRKKMGVLFQGGALFNSLTVGDNVALPLREHTKLDETTINIMVRLKLDLVGLSHTVEMFPNQLSGGMKKRAALARAMAMDPEFLFLDEPSAGLDPIVAAGIDHLILKLKKAFTMTIVVVTHELTSAYLIADRITMLDQGRILAEGTPEELKASTDERVRQFLDRRPEDESRDAQRYLESLVEGS